MIRIALGICGCGRMPIADKKGSFSFQVGNYLSVAWEDVLPQAV